MVSQSAVALGQGGRFGEREMSAFAFVARQTQMRQLVTEIGMGQKEDVERLVGGRVVDVRRDLGGIERVIVFAKH